MAELSHDELDLVMMAQVMAGCQSEQSSSRQGKDSTRTHTAFFHKGDRICQKTLFLHGIGYSRLKAIKASYLANGLCTQRHGNKGRSSKLGLSLKEIEEMVQFVMNYAGKSIHCRFNNLNVQHKQTRTCTVTLIDAHTTHTNAMLLPGRVPCYKSADVKLLPSSTMKKSIWELYLQVSADSSIRAVAYSTFTSLWGQLLPSVVTKPDRCVNKTARPSLELLIQRR